MDKGRLLKVIWIAVVTIALTGTLVIGADSQGTMTADEALKSLLDGNQRYVSNQMTGHKLCDLTTRESLAKHQKPYAIILSCSDSRVPPEIIFDKGLGEIFVVRVAGNVADPAILGSIEYGAEHLGSPLIMVLGHERCGAVTAAVEAKGKAEGNLGSIVRAITPAVQQARKESARKSKPELVETAIDDNVKLVAAALTKQSKVIEHLVAESKVKIVAAKYDLDDGKITLLK
ncbi:carbonic anhydrase [Geotalea sp. SG265]|uniref:carbonic anhydrase n=1 Tax=Geotalea sp. SG265 TaxID=2922867 RepID=UPI001FAF53C5|nr:carbonic anhydrase [Geotalea sp. SG265]